MQAVDPVFILSQTVAELFCLTLLSPVQLPWLLCEWDRFSHPFPFNLFVLLNLKCVHPGTLLLSIF